MCGFSLQVGQVTFGVLNLYRTAPGPLLHPELVKASAIATVSTCVLLHLRPGPARFEVHQTVGLLAGQLSLSAGGARCTAGSGGPQNSD